MSTGLRNEMLLYREWGRALFQLIPWPPLMVFDGLDRLAANAPAYRFLQVLLEEAPPHFHLCLLSREQPPLDIQTMRTKQEAVILTNEDLAFTLRETRNFLKLVRGLLLSAEAVRNLHRLTEGWVGGLILLCEALERLPEKEREAYFSEAILGKFKGEVFQFFGERAFSAHPPEVQEFLIRSSILDTLEPGILQDFVSLEKAHGILEGFSRKNLFVQAVYDRQKGWSYRYHQLFREFLQTRFHRRLSTEQQAAAYRQVACRYEQQDRLEEAVEYYLRGWDYPRVAARLERIGLEMVKSARLGDLSRWLAVLPAEVVQDNPWLLFYRFFTMRFSGTQEATANLEKAYSFFHQQQDVRGILLALAHLLELSIIGGHSSLPILSLIEASEGLLASPKSEKYSYERAVLLFQLGFAHFMRTGKCYQGYLACRNAYTLARSLGDISLQFNALLHAYANLTAMGEFSEASQLGQKIEELLRKYPYPGPQGLHFLHQSFHYLLQGDLQKAVPMLQQAQELAEKHCLLSLSLVVLMQTIILRNSSGNYQEAIALGHHLASLTQAIGNLYFYATTLTCLAQSFYQAGNYPEAWEMNRRAQEFLSAPVSLGLFHQRLCTGRFGLISCHYQAEKVNVAELEEVLY